MSSASVSLSLLLYLSVYLFSSLLSLSLCFTCLGYTVSPVILEAFVPYCLYIFCLKGSAIFLLSLLHSGLTWQFMWTYFQVTISAHCFHHDLYLSCDLSFNIHEFKQLQCATFAHDISARNPELWVFATHIFLIFLTSPSLTHFLSYTFLFISLCVFMCTMCVRPSSVFFFPWSCVGLWDRLPVMVLPCCFALFRVTATFLTCSFFSDSASWSEWS